MHHHRTPRRQTVAAVVATAAMLVVGVDLVAYAGNGDSLLLGRKNSSHGKTTVDNNGRGPALRLVTKPGAPPLAVSSGKRVRKLNADAVDGRSSKQLEPVTTRYAIGAGGETLALNEDHLIDLPAGSYAVSHRVTGSRTAGTTLHCFTFPVGELFDTGSYANLIGSTSTTSFVGITGTGAMVMPDDDQLTFRCEGDATVSLAAPVQVTVRKLTAVADGTVSPPAMPRIRRSITR